MDSKENLPYSLTEYLLSRTPAQNFASISAYGEMKFQTHLKHCGFCSRRYSEEVNSNGHIDGSQASEVELDQS